MAPIPNKRSKHENTLEALRSMTTVVADTADFTAMEKYKPTGNVILTFGVMLHM
jgi:hypothetical protein